MAKRTRAKEKEKPGISLLDTHSSLWRSWSTMIRGRVGDISVSRASVPEASANRRNTSHLQRVCPSPSTLNAKIRSNSWIQSFYPIFCMRLLKWHFFTLCFDFCLFLKGYMCASRSENVNICWFYRQRIDLTSNLSITPVSILRVSLRLHHI